jgi:hypothetical protein
MWYVLLWIQAFCAKKEEIFHLWWLSNLIHWCERIWSCSCFLHDNCFFLSMLGCCCLLQFQFSFGMVLYCCCWSNELLWVQTWFALVLLCIQWFNLIHVASKQQLPRTIHLPFFQ